MARVIRRSEANAESAFFQLLEALRSVGQASGKLTIALRESELERLRALEAERTHHPIPMDPAAPSKSEAESSEKPEEKEQLSKEANK